MEPLIALIVCYGIPLLGGLIYWWIAEPGDWLNSVWKAIERFLVWLAGTPRYLLSRHRKERTSLKRERAHLKRMRSGEADYKRQRKEWMEHKAERTKSQREMLTDWTQQFDSLLPVKVQETSSNLVECNAEREMANNAEKLDAMWHAMVTRAQVARAKAQDHGLQKQIAELVEKVKALEEPEEEPEEQVFKTQDGSTVAGYRRTTAWDDAKETPEGMLEHFEKRYPDGCPCETCMHFDRTIEQYGSTAVGMKRYKKRHAGIPGVRWPS